MSLLDHIEITVSSNISRARHIRGWMSDDELRWLAVITSLSSLVIEIGTYAGRSARAIGDNLPVNGKLICIDPFIPYTSEDLMPTPEVGNLIKQECIDNLSDLIESGRVSLLTTSSQDPFTLGSIPSKSADLVFIDGDHSYLSVLSDIDLWAPKVKDGGLLAGHDYGAHMGVSQAVEDRFSMSFDCPAGSIWSVQI